MKVCLGVALLSIIVCSAHDTEPSADCALDHDDTLLLQTRAATMTKDAKNNRRIHRYKIDMQDDVVSMLQGSTDFEAEVFYLCAQDASGIGVETTDAFHAKTDPCGNWTVTNEAGDPVGSMIACLPTSVAEGQCYNLVESPDFPSTHAGRSEVTSVPVVEDAGASDVFLIDIPAMDESALSEAIRQIQEKMALVSTGSALVSTAVLFKGAGALEAYDKMADPLTAVMVCLVVAFFLSVWWR